MKTIVLIKSAILRRERIIIIKNKEEIIFDKSESKKSINIDIEDTIIIKKHWVSSKLLNYNFFKHEGYYEIKPSLNNTWLAVIIAAIILLTMTTYPRFHNNFLIAITPFLVFSLYIFSYLTVFRNRYYLIKEI